MLQNGTLLSSVKELGTLALLVLLLSLTVLEVEVNAIYVTPWNLSCLLKILNGM